MAKRRGSGEGSIHYREKEKRYEAKVDFGIVNGKRKRPVVYGKTKAEVRAKLKALQDLKDAGSPPPDERLTVGKYLDQWLADDAPRRVGETTLDAYSRRIRLYLKPALGHIRLTKLTPMHVEAMMNDLEDRRLAISTIDGARKTLSVALRRAMAKGLITRNVAELVDGAGKSRTKMAKKKRRSLTLEQAAILIGAFSTARLQVAYLLTLAIGSRRGETLGLAWSDVDLDNGRLTLRQQLLRIPRKGLMLTDLKTEGSERTVPLPSEMITYLRAWKVQQSKERLAAGELWSNEADLVFTTPMGKPCDPDNFGHKLGKIAESAGLGHWTMHELRHSAGTLIFALGKEIRYITDILGHSSDRVTRDIYIHPQEEGKADALNALSQVLFGGRKTDAG